MHPSVCVCVYRRREQMWGFDLIKDEKIHSYMHIDILVRVLMWFSVRFASDCLWSQKKKYWYFHTYVLFSRMLRLLCLSLIPSFIIEGAHAHFILTTWRLTAVAHVTGASKLWSLWKWTCSFHLSSLTAPTHRSHMAGEAVTRCHPAGWRGRSCVQEVRRSSR